MNTKISHVTKEDREIVKVDKGNVIYFRENGNGYTTVQRFAVKPERYAEKIFLKHFWPWQRRKHILTLYKVVGTIVGVAVDGKLLYLVKPEDYSEGLRQRIAVEEQKYQNFLQQAQKKICALREEWRLLPVTMIARLEYLLAHMEMTEENLEKLATELAFCAEVNVLFKLDPGKICTAVPEWLKAHGYVKPDGTFFKEHLWFFKNGYNALVYDYGVMRGEELTKEKFSRYYDKLKFYTIESPWFKCRINDEMMEAFLLEQKESKN